VKKSGKEPWTCPRGEKKKKTGKRCWPVEKKREKPLPLGKRNQLKKRGATKRVAKPEKRGGGGEKKCSKKRKHVFFDKKKGREGESLFRGKSDNIIFPRERDCRTLQKKKNKKKKKRGVDTTVSSLKKENGKTRKKFGEGGTTPPFLAKEGRGYVHFKKKKKKSETSHRAEGTNQNLSTGGKKKAFNQTKTDSRRRKVIKSYSFQFGGGGIFFPAIKNRLS